MNRSLGVVVDDPYGIVDDASMPTAKSAMVPQRMQQRLEQGFAQLTGTEGLVRLQSIRVTRHKPGRRCVIEYGVDVEHPHGEVEQVALIAKIRARHSQGGIYRLQQALWQRGFADDSADGISIPQPIGRIKEYKLWLQRKVAGEGIWAQLCSSQGEYYARRIAAAAHKIHRVGPAPERSHNMADELHILHQRLPAVVEQYPAWEGRIGAVLEAANRLGASVPEPQPCGIHRDFYHEQIIVADTRLYLLDFDLYCLGDPALDIGNFIAHISEQSLRSFGDAAALASLEQLMEDHFVALAGEQTRYALRAYTILTLLRHIHLSTLFAERRPYTESLLGLCEERLANAGFRP